MVATEAQGAPLVTAPARRPTRNDRLAIPALVLGMAVSNIGNNLTAIAIPWFVLLTTGSAARTGLVAAVGLLPLIITGALGGAFVDRIGFKRSSILSDLLSGASVAAIPTLHVLGVLRFWHLLAFVFIGAIFDSPGWTAREALLPQLASRANTPLERANASYQLAQFLASFIGPLAAGVLIAAISASNVLFLDAGSFAFSALVVAVAIRAPRRAPTPSADRARKSPFAEVAEALRFMLTERLIVIMVVLSVGANFLFSPLFAVVFPVYAQRVFGDPRALGFLVASFGAGSVVGVVAYGIIGPRLRRFPVFLGGVALASGGIWALPFSTHIAVSIAAGAVAGLGLGPINALAMTLLQERTPEEMLGRVLGALGSATQLATPLSVLLAGVTIEWVGVRGVMVIIAAGFTAVVAIAALHPAVRDMDTAPAAPAEA